MAWKIDASLIVPLLTGDDGDFLIVFPFFLNGRCSRLVMSLFMNGTSYFPEKPPGQKPLFTKTIAEK